MGLANEAEEEGDDGVTHLFDLISIDVDEAEAKVDGKSRVHIARSAKSRQRMSHQSSRHC